MTRGGSMRSSWAGNAARASAGGTKLADKCRTPHLLEPAHDPELRGRLPESRRREAIERYLEDVVLASFPILDYDRATAEWHARERVRLEAAGKTPPFVDGQIAAIACVNDLVLVTANRADFRGFKGLRVESWV